jgi:hypothetical protein
MDTPVFEPQNVARCQGVTSEKVLVGAVQRAGGEREHDPVH